MISRPLEVRLMWNSAIVLSFVGCLGLAGCAKSDGAPESTRSSDGKDAAGNTEGTGGAGGRSPIPTTATAAEVGGSGGSEQEPRGSGGDTRVPAGSSSAASGGAPSEAPGDPSPNPSLGVGGQPTGPAPDAGAGGAPAVDPGPPCPVSSPSGGRCSDPGRICTYGESPRPECRTEVTCTDGEWVEEPRECEPPLPASECDDTPIGSGRSCSFNGICAHPGGVECACSPDRASQCYGTEADGSCPSTPPNAGTGCTPSQVDECRYPCSNHSAYNLATVCEEDGLWSWRLALCDSDCTRDGQTVAEGMPFAAADGCNTCLCVDGLIECTKDSCTSCAVDGDCGADEVCVPETESCSERRYCRAQGTECFRERDAPVCGCNDTTYANACAALVEGVGIASFGTCNGDCVRSGVVFRNGDSADPLLQCEECTCRDGIVECQFTEPNTCTLQLPAQSAAD